MHVNFLVNRNGPERMAADAELVFGPECGPLDGMKVVGFSVWKGAEGDLYVTFPSRAFGSAADRKYFDYLRPVEGGAAGARKVKEWILASYKAQLAG